MTAQYLVVDLTASENREFVFKRERHFVVLQGPFENLTIEKSASDLFVVQTSYMP